MLRNTTPVTYQFLALTALAATNCSSAGVCGPDCPKVEISLSQNALDKANGGVLKGSVLNYTKNPPPKVQLVSAKGVSLKLDVPMLVADGAPQCGSAATPCANSATFSVAVQQDLTSLFDGSALSLVYQDDDGSGPASGLREARSPVVLAKLLVDSASFTVTGTTASPMIERLGFSGGKLLALRSYQKSMATKKSLLQYTTNLMEFKQEGPPSGALATELTSDYATAAFADSRVVYLDYVPPPKAGLSLTSCPKSAASVSECANPSSMGLTDGLLPTTLKKFAVAPGGEVAVFAQEDGVLRLAGLPYQAANPPPLVWSSLGAQPTVGRKDRILLAPADLNKDGAVDLIAIHQDGKNQDVTVYMGRLGEIPPKLNYDAKISAAWQMTLGSTPLVSAIAVGDLNGDERADVVVSRGLHVDAWLTREALAPVLGWTVDVPVTDTTVSAKAMAIGKVEGTNKNVLGIASSSAPDSMGNVAQQYVHVFFAP